MEVSLLPPEDPASSVVEHRRRIVKNIEIAQKIARDNITRAQQKQKEYYDRNAKEKNFVEGSKVWVFVPKAKKGLSKKLLHNYHGPYRVVEKLSPVHYRLRTCSNKPVSAIVHANRMRPFIDPHDRPIEPPADLLDELYLAENDFPPDSFEPLTTGPSTSHTKDPLNTTNTVEHSGIQPREISTPDEVSKTLIDNDTVFNAETLLQYRKRNGQNQYLVKWVGYPESEVTWEPESNILDARLIENFEATHSTP